MGPPKRCPPELNEDVTGEILLRIPPDEPEHLIRASIVCRRPSPPQQPEQEHEHAAGSREPTAPTLPSVSGPAGPTASAQDPWSNIPLDLAGLVLERLPAHVDRVRFAAVCPQWRSAARQVKLPPPMPLLVLKAENYVYEDIYSMPRGEPLHFSGYRDGHFVTGCRPGFYAACGNWLVYRRVFDILLLDPLSGATMTLPTQSSVQLADKANGDDSVDEAEDSKDNHDSADEGDDSVNEVEDSKDNHDSADKGDDSEDGSADEGDDSEDHPADESDDSSDGSADWELLMDMRYADVMKLRVCSPNLVAALFQRESTRIAVCRPGGSVWSVARDLSLWITDMAFYQGMLYVVDFHEDLLALDISVDDNTGDPQVARIRRVININQFDNDRTLLRTLYLVESCGSLLLVRRRISDTHVHDDGQIHTFAGQCEPDLSIFEADFARSQWVKVTILADNQALFLGPCSRAVCMPQSHSTGNRVWFLDDYKDFYYSSEYQRRLLSETSSVVIPKPFSPLPMISWRSYLGNAGAAWLFPAN